MKKSILLLLCLLGLMQNVSAAGVRSGDPGDPIVLNLIGIGKIHLRNGIDFNPPVGAIVRIEYGELKEKVYHLFGSLNNNLYFCS